MQKQKVGRRLWLIAIRKIVKKSKRFILLLINGFYLLLPRPVRNHFIRHIIINY